MPAEHGFLIAFEFHDDDRPLIVEDDGRVCYAYIRGPWGKVVNHVWLYNRIIAPDPAEWESLGMVAPFPNPTSHALDWGEKPFPCYTEFSSSISKSVNGPTTFSVFIRGELFAILRIGDEVGRSKLVKKDGPFALRLPEPGSISWKVVSSYWQTVDIHGGGDAFLRNFAEVPEPVGHLLAVTWCQSEVCNGGFHQFFMNSTGVLAPEAARGFRVIKMPIVAEMVEMAMSVFGTPYPRERKQRQKFLSSIAEDAEDDAEREWNLFHDLDDAFYSAIGDDCLNEAVDEYASRGVPEVHLKSTPESQRWGRICYVGLRSAASTNEASQYG